MAGRGGLAGAQARVTGNHSAGAYVDSGKVRLVLMALVACLAGCGGAEAETADGAVRLQKVGTRSTRLCTSTRRPRTAAGSSSSSRAGEIRVVATARARAAVPRPPSRVILRRRAGAALDGLRPRLRESRRFYVDYTDTRRATGGRVPAPAHPRATPGRARGDVFRIDGPEANHNGGRSSAPTGCSTSERAMAAAATTSTARAAMGQDLGELVGELLRWTRAPRRAPVHDTVIATRSAGAGVRPEIYSYGCATRGASRSTARPATWSIGDVGQSAGEEIDFVARGGRGRELRLAPGRGQARATRRARALPAPTRRSIAAADAGNCSVTGGFRRARSRVPGLAGQYVYGDYCKGEPPVGEAVGRLGERRPAARPEASTQLSSFGEDARGRVYVVSLGGPVYRLAAG